MKRILLLVIELIIHELICNGNLAYNVNWISEDNIYITTKPNAYVYLTSSKGKDTFKNTYTDSLCYSQEYKNKTSWNKDFDKARKITNYHENKKRKLKKPITAKVRGFTNKTEQMQYDTYIIEIKDILYYLPVQFVEDNSVINSYNTRCR